MYQVKRIAENPFLMPNEDESWQSYAAFNPCVVNGGHAYHLLFRAMSAPQQHHGIQMSLSTIGYSCSETPFSFKQTQQLIKPEEDWERFGCEDPRVTKLDDTYYIFYTALSAYPFQAQDIRIGVALTKDFQTITEKHLVTPFNSKAMALFPEKINGKYAAILTTDTDKPPAKISLAFFNKISDIWCESYWEKWYASLENHIIPLLRSSQDHVEVGAPPIKTEHGWLIIYSYIKNYFTDTRVFGIEAVLLDLKNPVQVVGRTKQPLLVPEKEYELKGDVPNVIFPSGALLENKKLFITYGGADTTCCGAELNIDDLLNSMQSVSNPEFIPSKNIPNSFLRYVGNPIIEPRPEVAWEGMSTFNPAAIYEGGKFHIIYRAMSMDGTSVFGYAASKDGVHIDERLLTPIYVPRESFEMKLKPGFSGCEDPRITKLDDRFYIFYTAYDGYMPRVAFTSIKVKDFLNKKWHWATPQVITPPHVDDKDACLFPRKIKDKYVIIHRFNNNMYINYVDSLNFGKDKWLEHGGYMIAPKKAYWDNKKFGLATPPIETEQGWLLLFHRVADPSIYKVEALLLDLEDPTKVIAETESSLFEPEMDYEKVGDVNNVVFPCGAVLLDGEVYIYYGGADKVVGVAKMALSEILKCFTVGL